MLSARDIFATSGTLAVVAGPLQLAYQINHATQIATTQARAEYSAGWRGVDSTRQSENFAEVLAKSIYNPNELKPSEIPELDANYTGILDQVQSAKVNWETGSRTSHWKVSVDFDGKRFAENHELSQFSGYI